MLRKEEPHVVILGGGFAGLAAARGLRHARARVTLIDRSNHHLFQPLLYQVATAALAAPDIAAPIRKLLSRQQNATVLMANVGRIDVEARTLLLEDASTIEFDYLIVATGMVHTYFGHDEWAEHAPGLKTLREALDIRARVLRAFEAAEREPDPHKRRAFTTFVVVGGGPTGVELAGALAEIAGRTLARDFRRFDPTTTRVVLVEAGPRVLSSFSEELSKRACAALEKLGVDIRTGTPVGEITDRHVTVGDEDIEARTVLWAAGLVASPLTKQLGVPTDRVGRVHVEDDLTIPGHDHVYVLGDLIAKEQDGKPLPGVAQNAMQSGALAARNVIATIEGRPRAPYRYDDKGSMATIGRNKAVAQIGKREVSGFFAWLLWAFIHVLFLVDFRNRVAVLAEWAWVYVTWQRSSRVILDAPVEHPPRRSLAPDAPSRVPADPPETPASHP